MRILGLLAAFLFTLNSLHCTLWPYGAQNGDKAFDRRKISTPFDGSPKSVIFTFNEDIIMFGENVKSIKVSPNLPNFLV